MTAEALLRDREVVRALKARRKQARRRISPEELLCEILNGLAPAQKTAVAQRLR